MVARTLENFWSVRSRSSNPRVLVFSRYISLIHFGQSGSFCHSKPSLIVRNEQNLCTVQTPIHVVYSTVSVRTKYLVRPCDRPFTDHRAWTTRSLNTLRYSPLLVLLVLGPICPTYSITARSFRRIIIYLPELYLDLHSIFLGVGGTSWPIYITWITLLIAELRWMIIYLITTKSISASKKSLINVTVTIS